MCLNKSYLVVVAAEGGLVPLVQVGEVGGQVTDPNKMVQDELVRNFINIEFHLDEIKIYLPKFKAPLLQVVFAHPADDLLLHLSHCCVLQSGLIA